jgi:hypothetical protein
MKRAHHDRSLSRGSSWRCTRHAQCSALKPPISRRGAAAFRPAHALAPRLVPTNGPYKRQAADLKLLVSGLRICKEARKTTILGGGGYRQSSDHWVMYPTKRLVTASCQCSACAAALHQSRTTRDHAPRNSGELRAHGNPSVMMGSKIAQRSPSSAAILSKPTRRVGSDRLLS